MFLCGALMPVGHGLLLLVLLFSLLAFVSPRAWSGVSVARALGPLEEQPGAGGGNAATHNSTNDCQALSGVERVPWRC